MEKPQCNRLRDKQVILTNEQFILIKTFNTKRPSWSLFFTKILYKFSNPIINF